MLDSSLASNNASSNGFNLVSTLGLAEWVKLLHQVAVLKRVLLVLVVESHVCAWCSQLALDSIRVDNSGKISTVHGSSFELISVLLNSLGAISSENLVETFESILSENNQSTEVATWSQLEQVESVNIANVNSWKVASGLLNLCICITIDDKRSLAEDEA